MRPYPERMKNKTHKILHVDGDNFFVACEVARFPHLKGTAVVVGEERGIACAMSYAAKELGITRAMPISDMIPKINQAVHATLSLDSIVQAANFGLKFKATGISVHGLRPLEAVQDDLFATQSASDTRSKYLEAVDSLQKRFGDGSICLCSSLESKKSRLAAFNERNSRNRFTYGLPLPYMGEVV